MKSLFLILCWVLSLAASAQPPAHDPAEKGEAPVAQEPLVTDRPDVAESAVTVGAGRVQLETGVTLGRSDGQFTTTFPTLVRVGLDDRWELRVEGDLFVLQNPGLDSFADSSLGAKVNLLDSEHTSLGLLMSVSIPIGPDSVRGTVDPALAVLLDQSLVGDLGLGFNAGLTLSEAAGTRFTQFFWATSFSHPLGESVTGYIEFYGEGPDGPGATVQTAADGGFLLLLDNDLQLDLSYAKGLSGSGFEWAVGLGLSSRF